MCQFQDFLSLSGVNILQQTIANAHIAKAQQPVTEQSDTNNEPFQHFYNWSIIALTQKDT